MNVKKILLISFLLLSGCASQPSVDYDSGSEISKLQDTIQNMQSQIIDLETKVEDLEYKNEYLTQDVDDLRDQVEATESYSYETFNEDNNSNEQVSTEQKPEQTSNTSNINPNNPSGYFTIGSTMAHVEEIMGSPDSVVLTSWWYGKHSWVSFDKNGLVDSFYNGGNNLKTK